VSNHQHQGGKNNKDGNYYEDYFTTHRALLLAVDYVFNGTDARYWEQHPKATVDDLVVEQSEHWSYYQLKADKKITWGEEDSKLKTKFENQKTLCVSEGQSFELCVVVADFDRKESLDKYLPDSIQDVTRTLLFPRMQRVRELARLIDELKIPFDHLTARRFPDVSAIEEFTEAFHSERTNFISTEDGIVSTEDVVPVYISSLVSMLQSQDRGQFVNPWDELLEGWPEAKAILSKIRGFQFWVDRGIFQWQYCGSLYEGWRVSCRSDGFQRFVRRVLDHKPTNLEELDDLLP
jgi:hypothetical protein